MRLPPAGPLAGFVPLATRVFRTGFIKRRCELILELLRDWGGVAVIVGMVIILDENRSSSIVEWLQLKAKV
jgi:hypothetical protein